MSEIDQLTDKPNNLFIETTGIADAGELAANFQSLYIAESFDLKKIITVIDAQNVRLYKDDNPEIVKQIVAADILIINKTNLIEVEVIVEIKDFIKSINPYAVMFLSKDGHLDRKFLDAPNVDKTFTNSTIYKSENNHKIKTTLFETDKYFDIQKLRYELFKSLYLFYNQIYRIKGYVLNEKKEVFLVQSVGKSSTITLIENKEIEKSQLVFIGKDLELKSLERILKPAFAKKIKSDKILIS